MDRSAPSPVGALPRWGPPIMHGAAPGPDASARGPADPERRAPRERYGRSGPSLVARPRTDAPHDHVFRPCRAHPAGLRPAADAIAFTGSPSFMVVDPARGDLTRATPRERHDARRSALAAAGQDPPGRPGAETRSPPPSPRPPMATAARPWPTAGSRIRARAVDRPAAHASNRDRPSARRSERHPT
jgi:hypothetical protein